MLPSTPFSEFKATSQLNKEKSQVGTLVNVKTRDFPKFTLTKRFDKKTTTELTDIVPDGQYLQESTTDLNFGQALRN